MILQILDPDECVRNIYVCIADQTHHLLTPLTSSS